MAEAYLNDQKKLLPCAVQLNGEYGVKMFMQVFLLSLEKMV
jgi:malate/lactate dehydrogenase